MSLLAIVDTEGIVTKETKYGDTSRILTVITRNMGKISVLAGNVRKGKSGLLSATSLFTYSRFTLFKSGSSSLYKLNEGEVIASFSNLKNSLDAMAYASYFCDVTNSVMQENSSEPEQTDLLLRALYLIDKNPETAEKIKAVFEFRTLTIAGLMPNLSECAGCGKTNGLTSLCPQNGSVYCEKCGISYPSIRINDSILAALSYIELAESKKIFSFNMSEKSIAYLSLLGEQCIEILLEKNFKTLKYLKNVTSL